jgi:TP901 family phage tail tape measure protein
MALPKAGVQLVAEGAASFTSAIDAGAKAVGSFVGATQSGSKGVSAFGQIAIGALRRVGEAVVEMAAAGAKAIGSFVSDSISQAGDFESGMLRFASISGLKAGSAQLKDFSALFLKLGADTQFSAAQAEEAAINLAKGGLTPAQIAGGALADTLTLASAGELDLAQAAEITAKALGVWADQGVTSAQVANLLAEAANASTVDVDELAQGLYNSQGIAKLAGASFQDLTTALGLVAPGFASAADAGTSMKVFLSSLQPATKPARKAFEELNLLAKDGSSAFYDAQGNFVGFAKAADLLKTSLQGMTKAQQEATLKTIFGQDGIRVAAILAEKGAAGFEEFAASMAATGSAADQAAAKNQGFNFALEALSGSIDTLKIVLGSALLPLLTSFLNDYITPGVNALMTFSGAVTGNADAFNSLSPPLQAVATTLQYLGQVFSEAMASFQTDGPAAAISTFAAGLDALVPGAAAATQAVLGFVGALPAIAGAVGSAAGALAGPWIAAFSSIAPAAQTALASVQAIITSVIATIQGTTQAQLTTIQTSFMMAWTAVATTTGQVWNGILSIINPILAQIAAFIAANGTEIRAFFVQTWTQIASIVTTEMQIIQTTIVPILKSIGAFIAAHGTEIQAVLSAAWTTIKTIVTTVLAAIQGVLTATMQAIQGDWSGAWQTIQKTSATIVQGLLTLLQTNLALLKTIFATAIDAAIAVVTGSATRFAGAGRAIIDGIINGVKSGIGALKDAVTGAAQDALNAAKDALGISSPSKEAADLIGSPFVQGIIVGITGESSNLYAAVAKMSDDLLSLLGDLVDKAQSLMADAFRGIADMARTNLSNLDLSAKITGTDKTTDLEQQRQDLIKRQQQQAQDTANKLTAIDRERANKEQDIRDKATADEADRQEQIAEVNATADFAENKAAKIAAINKEYDKKAAARQKELDDLAEASAQRRSDIASSASQQQQDSAEQLAALEKQLADARAKAAARQGVADMAQRRLLEAQQQALQIGATDAKTGADFLALRSKQIEEMAELEAKRAEAFATGDQTAVQDADQRIALLQQAQAAELSLFDQQAQARQQDINDYQRQLGQVQAGGGQIAAGIIEGIRNSLGPLSDAIAGAVRAAVQSTQQYLGGSGGTGGGVVSAPLAGGRVMPVQTAANTYNRSYTDASTTNAPMSIQTNVTEARLVATINRVLDQRTTRANGIRATGGYGGT